MVTRLAAAGVLCLSLALSTGRAALSEGVGALGDSLTDEYVFSGRNQARSWVEQLVTHRGLNFGSVSTTSRGEPRLSGFEFNWARRGATSTALLSQGQHFGLAAQINEGKVSYVFLGIGGDDFAEAYSPIYNGTLAGQELNGFVSTVVGNISAAMDTVSIPGRTKLVITTIPDIGGSPAAVAMFPEEAQRRQVTNAAAAANAKLLAIAATLSIPVIDLFALQKTLLDSPQRLTIGGFTLDATPGDDPRHAFLADGAHPGSVLQGIIGNAFLQAIVMAYGADVDLRSDQEILSDAGITPPIVGPTYFDVARVIVYEPKRIPVVLTQVAVGGGFETVFSLLNTGGSFATGNLVFGQPSGNPLRVRLKNNSAPGSAPVDGSSFPITPAVPPGGVRMLTASAISPDAETSSGWARVEGTGGRLGGVAAFQLRSGVTLQSIAGVLAARQVPFGTIPVDNDDALARYTGFAVANPTDEPIYLRLILMDEAGRIVRDILPPPMHPVLPRGQASIFLHELFPALLTFRGSMVLVSLAEQPFSVVALIQDRGMLTAVPVIPEKPRHVPNYSPETRPR